MILIPSDCRRGDIDNFYILAVPSIVFRIVENYPTTGVMFAGSADLFRTKTRELLYDLYTLSAGILTVFSSFTAMPGTASLKPGPTLPFPSVNTNGVAFTFVSKTLPSSSIPVYYTVTVSPTFATKELNITNPKMAIIMIPATNMIP